jgi:alpha-tubulin suppressor-like RCC1 family protein
MRLVLAGLLAVAAASCARNPASLARPTTPMRILDVEEVRGSYWGVRAVVRGHGHSCAVLDDGSVRCWGHNDKGQLGFTSTEQCHVIEGLEFPCTSKPTLVPGLSKVKLVALGASHTCAMLDDETVRCWGDDALGQLGDGPRPTKEYTSAPTLVPGLAGIVHVAAGADHTCALTHDWRVLCWGRGTDGALGAPPSHDVCFGIDSRTACTRSATSVPGLPGVAHFMLGENVTCVFAHDGTSRCWKRDED